VASQGLRTLINRHCIVASAPTISSRSSPCAHQLVSGAHAKSLLQPSCPARSAKSAPKWLVGARLSPILPSPPIHQPASEEFTGTRLLSCHDAPKREFVGAGRDRPDPVPSPVRTGWFVSRCGEALLPRSAEAMVLLASAIEYSASIMPILQRLVSAGGSHSAPEPRAVARVRQPEAGAFPSGAAVYEWCPCLNLALWLPVALWWQSVASQCRPLAPRSGASFLIRAHGGLVLVLT